MKLTPVLHDQQLRSLWGFSPTHKDLTPRMVPKNTEGISPASPRLCQVGSAQPSALRALLQLRTHLVAPARQICSGAMWHISSTHITGSTALASLGDSLTGGAFCTPHALALRLWSSTQSVRAIQRKRPRLFRVHGRHEQNIRLNGIRNKVKIFPKSVFWITCKMHSVSFFL